jgi:hypothetical protein
MFAVRAGGAMRIPNLQEGLLSTAWELPSEVSEFFKGQRHTDAVERGDQVDDLLGDGAADGRQVSEQSGGHAQGTQDHASA